jgi:hypothetical protein
MRELKSEALFREQPRSRYTNASEIVNTDEPMRRAAKIDGNHAAIVAGLRSVGASVTPLHAVANGCPDLLVGFRGVNYAIEVKDGSLSPSERLLTPQQKKWHAEWQGKAHVANSLMEALLIIGARTLDGR